MQLKLFDDTYYESHIPEDYIVQSGNKKAYEFLMENKLWNALILYGGEGSGKTHLSQVWIKSSGAVLYKRQNQHEKKYIKNGTVIENIDKISEEEELLYCYNSALENNARLLMTSSVPPESIKFKLKDLSSRILSTLSIKIAPPDKELMKVVLLKYFIEKQFVIDMPVINKIIDMFPKSMKKLRSFVTLLENESNKKITKSFMIATAQKIASDSKNINPGK